MGFQPETLLPALNALDCERCGAPLILRVDKEVGCSQCGHRPVATDDIEVALQHTIDLRSKQKSPSWTSIASNCSECGAQILAAIEEDVLSCDFCGSKLLSSTKGAEVPPLPDLMAEPWYPAQTSSENVDKQLRSGKLKRILGRQVSSAVLRLLAKHASSPRVQPMLLPVYSFRLRLRLRTTKQAKDRLKDVALPGVLELTGISAHGSELWGGKKLRVDLRIPEEADLVPWRALPNHRVQSVNVHPQDALREVLGQAQIAADRRLRQMLGAFGGRCRLQDLERQVIGVSFLTVSMPVHVVTIESRHHKVRLLVDALNGDILGTPGRKKDIPKVRWLPRQQWSGRGIDTRGLQALNNIRAEDWQAAGFITLMLIGVNAFLVFYDPVFLWGLALMVPLMFAFFVISEKVKDNFRR